MKMLITGAGSGIGRAVALGAARQASENSPVELFLVDQNADALAAVSADVDALGAASSVAVVDLSDPEVPAALATQVSETMGGLDALISNAGIGRAGALTELTLDDYEIVMNVDARVTWLLGKAMHPLLKASRGAIVATASVSGTHATPPMGSYSAAKAAVMMLIKQMALEWGPDGIRANTVSPGPTVTGMTFNAFGGDGPEQRANRARRESMIPLRKIGQAEDVANAILFLAGPTASQITGVDLVVDGGLTLTLMPNSGSGAAAAPNAT